MHKNHFVGCAVGIALAIIVVVLAGGSAGSFGVLGAAVICPIVMVGFMWFLMGNNRTDRRPDAVITDHDTTQSARS